MQVSMQNDPDEFGNFHYVAWEDPQMSEGVRRCQRDFRWVTSREGLEFLKGKTADNEVWRPRWLLHFDHD